MKKLLLFVLVLLALMAAAAFLVVTWLRAEEAERRAGICGVPVGAPGGGAEEV